MALAGIEGQENISGDIIVHGKDQKEHDLQLEKVIVRLKERGLTLNAEKCQFSMDKLTFFSMVLSRNGISCTEEKVKAMKEAWEPWTVSVTWSLLELVNYCGHFIPDLATISEPLRCLTKSGTPFTFGGEQKKAFQELKEWLARLRLWGTSTKMLQPQYLLMPVQLNWERYWPKSRRMDQESSAMQVIVWQTPREDIRRQRKRRWCS